MATLPTAAQISGQNTTNGEQKTYLAALRNVVADYFGTGDSANKALARATFGALSRVDILASLAVNGYVTIPIADNKVLIIQQASVSVTTLNGYAQAFPFPIRFPTTCLVVVGGGDATGSSAMVKVARASGDLSGQFICKNWGSGAETANIIAIGC